MTETTNKISYFERRFVQLEDAVYKAAESVDIPTRHFLNGLGNQDIRPEALAMKMAERIKELQVEVQRLKNPEPEAPRLMFSPTIEQIIENTVRRFLIPRIMDGATEFRVHQEKIVQYDAESKVIGTFYVGHLGLKKSLTADEWNHLKLKVRNKIVAEYESKGLRDARPEDVENL